MGCLHWYASSFLMHAGLQQIRLVLGDHRHKNHNMIALAILYKRFPDGCCVYTVWSPAEHCNTAM